MTRTYASAPALPRERPDAAADFPGAGVHVRATARHYTVVGASNGGVVKVFDRAARALVYNDGGYVGQDARGAYVTTQGTGTGRATAAADEVRVEAPFQVMPRALPSPARFLVLRGLNLTAMRSLALGNALKRVLVRLLISGKKPAPLVLERTVRFAPAGVTVSDVVRARGRVRMRWLECGRPFVGIHMASARYFEGFEAAGAPGEARRMDVEALAGAGEARLEVTVGSTASGAGPSGAA